MSVNQVFLMATRSGGLALHRPDLGIIAAGTAADLVLWDAGAPNMLGWRDPVAAVILHANVGDVVDVMVGGKFVKEGGKLLDHNYTAIKNRFLDSVNRIQKLWVSMPLPVPAMTFNNDGFDIVEADTVDTLRGPGNGYGDTFLML